MTEAIGELLADSMGDELFDVRNSLIVGNFHQAIAEGNSARTVLRKPEDIAAFNADRDALVARAQIALGQHNAVIHDFKNATHPTHVAVRLWAETSRDIASGGTGELHIQKLRDMISGEDVVAGKGDAAVIAIAALIHARDIPGALTLANRWISGLDSTHHQRVVIELRALVADAYLRMNRPDLAEKEVTHMRGIDDESTLTLLMHGVVALQLAAVKRDRYNEAVAQFQEVSSRCGQSVLILNLLALAHMGRGAAAEAERCLMEAMAKKSGDGDTTANLVAVNAHSGKTMDSLQRHVTQACNASSIWATNYVAMERRFQEAVSTFALQE